jgi:hypothetical protein
MKFLGEDGCGRIMWRIEEKRKELKRDYWITI